MTERPTRRYDCAAHGHGMPVNNPTKCEDCGGFLEFDNTTRKAVCPTCEWRSRSTPTQQGAPTPNECVIADCTDEGGPWIPTKAGWICETHWADIEAAIAENRRAALVPQPPSSCERRDSARGDLQRLADYVRDPSKTAAEWDDLRSRAAKEGLVRPVGERRDSAPLWICKKCGATGTAWTREIADAFHREASPRCSYSPAWNWPSERRDEVTDATITDLVRRIEHVAALNRADSTCVVPRELLMSIRARLLWAASEHAGATDADECLCGHPRDGHEALSEDGAFIEAWGACSVGCGCLCYTTTGLLPSSGIQETL